MKINQIIILTLIFYSITSQLNALNKCDFQFIQENHNRINPPTLEKMIYSPSGEFRIHFDTTGVNAPDLIDENENGIPDYVDMVGITIDYVQFVISEVMGYVKVPDVNEPPYPIYIDNRNSGSYGVNWAEGNSDEAPFGWIEIDNDYGAESGYFTSGIDAMQVSVAHEYFHAIQRVYRQPSLGVTYFYEFSSTWIEELIFPENNDYVYWIDNFNDAPATPFNSTDGYSVASFGHYLNTLVEGLDDGNLLNNQLMRQVWENFDSPNDDPLNILSQILTADYNTNFMSCWSEFIARNYFNGQESNLHYYSDQILMSPITTGMNTEILYTNLNFDQVLYDDRITIQTIIPVVNGIINISLDNQLVLGNLIKKGIEDQIFYFDENLTLNVNQEDIVTFILYSENENDFINYSIEFIEYLNNNDHTQKLLNKYILKYPFPNPFNPTTTISISIPEQSQTSVKVYDIKGNLISTLLNQSMNVGHHQIEWNAEGIPSGVYFVKMVAEDPSINSGQGFTKSQKVILMK